MIKATDIRKAYHKENVLEDLNLHVKKGSIYGLIGSNGAGKSTLLNILSGVFKPDFGKVQIDGEEVFENIKIKNKIAYITDNPYYFNSATVKEMALYLNKIYSNFSMQTFEEISALFPIDINKRINSFSKGMKRQVSIILSLSQNPEILLCDESFDGLDPVIRQLVKRLFVSRAAEGNMTVIIASHNLREMENLCDTVGVLHDNKIVIEKSIGDIKNMMHRYQVAYKPMIDTEILEQRLDIVSMNIRNNVIELVARGEDEEIYKTLSEYDPLLIDKTDLTLEDIFVYEMEVKGYDFSKMLL